MEIIQEALLGAGQRHSGFFSNRGGDSSGTSYKKHHRNTVYHTVPDPCVDIRQILLESHGLLKP